MTAQLVVGTLFILAAVALILLGALATVGKLPGNSAIGLRVPEVRKDENIWNQAHKVAGPFWLFAGVALAFGAAFAFIAHGWLWIAPIITVVLAIVALSVAGNFGARAAALVDAARNDSPAQPTQATPATQVNLDALRAAAAKADEDPRA